MTKRTTLLTSLIITAVILLGSWLAFRAYHHDQQEDTTTDTTISTKSETASGRPILLSQFNAQFSLPARIDVNDIKIGYIHTDSYDTAHVLSKSLATKVNHTMCSGKSLNLGSFAVITRYDTPKEGRVKMGDYYYYIADGPGYKTCYDQASYQNYYNEDVVKTIRASLAEQ